MKLYVGKRDIEAAKIARNNSYSNRAENCPIAQALKRKYPHFTPWVVSYRITLVRNDTYTREKAFYPSKAAIAFMDRADNFYDNVKPITLTLTEAGYG